MKKKLLSVSLAIAVMTAATACGNGAVTENGSDAGNSVDAGTEVSVTNGDSADSVEDPNATDNESDESVDGDSNNAEEGAGGDLEAADSADAEGNGDSAKGSGNVETPVIINTSENLYVADESGATYEPLLTGYITRLMLSEDSAKAYPELDKALTEYVETVAESAQSEADEYLDINKQDRELSSGDEEPHYYSAFMNQNLYVTRADSKYLSVLSSRESYAGGAHEYTGYDAVTFDTVTGEELTIADVIPDEDALIEAMRLQMIERYGEDGLMISTDEAEFAEEISHYTSGEYDPENPYTDEFGTTYELIWDMNVSGIDVVFNAYDIAAYATGTIVTHIPYDSEIVSDACKPDDNCTLVTEIPKYMSIIADTNGDGTSEDYYCGGETMADAYDYYEKISVQGSESSVEITDCYCYDYSHCLARVGDKYFMIVDTVGDSDAHSEYCFELNGGSVSQVADYNGGDARNYYDHENNEFYTYCLTDSSKMMLETRFDILSTYSGYKTYTLGEDGMVTTDDEFYDVDAWFTLVSKADIEGDVVDEEGNVISTETFPSGTEYKIIRTDGSSIVDAMTGDGKIARFEVGTSEDTLYSYTIGGVSIDELFEQLYFAG